MSLNTKNIRVCDAGKVDDFCPGIAVENGKTNLVRNAIAGLAFGILLCLAGRVHAQNLNFNQVLLLQLTAPVQDTVPTGKVWKVEQVGVNSTSKGAWALVLNGKVFTMYNQNSSSSSAYHDYSGPRGPIWLPEGTIIRGFTNSLDYTFSILEFNVAP